jgi:TM2 domain-containing membrane protein YozV
MTGRAKLAKCNVCGRQAGYGASVCRACNAPRPLAASVADTTRTPRERRADSFKRNKGGVHQRLESIPSEPGATRPCPYCAEPILLAAKKCKHCGEFLVARDSASRDSRTPRSGKSLAPHVSTGSNGVGALLSLIIPGAGQLVGGAVGRGVGLFLATTMLYACMLIINPFFSLPAVAVHLFSVFDAAQISPG